MNLILAIPMEYRLALAFMLGACIGSLANLGIYRLAWHPRPISPWSRPDPRAPPRRLTDRLPIIGWLGLRRETALHGTGFWIRPLLVELLTGAGLAGLYWWEIGAAGLLPKELPRPVAPDLLPVLHVQFAAHAVLISLMLVASVIDADEKTIPDTITVPGTLFGLLMAAAYPWSLLPSLVVLPNDLIPANFWQLVMVEKWPFLQLTSPNVWPARLDGFPYAESLAIGLGCWWLWCVALMPGSWYSRHGWRRALQLSIARMIREWSTYLILVMGLIGSLAIAAVWSACGAHWRGLLSALVGMAASGGLIWTVRVVCFAALRREAMGFGDVTLMAMIGTVLGWQTCLIVFFAAPLIAVGIGVLRLVLLRDKEIPYGPFLCLATGAMIVCWPAIWNWAWPIFALGWLVPLIVLFCVCLMYVMLRLWRLILESFP